MRGKNSSVLIVGADIISDSYERTDIDFWNQRCRKYFPAFSGSTAQLDQERKQEGFTNTTELAIRANLSEQIEILFFGALEEESEDENESDFSREIARMVELYGEAALYDIASLILYKDKNEVVSAQALRTLGRIEHKPTHSFRLWLLKEALKSSSLGIRDAAGLGLAYLNDVTAISSLSEAVARERYGALRESLEQVISLLERNFRWRSSS